MKRILSVLMTLIIVFSFAACGGNTNETETTTTAPAASSTRYKDIMGDVATFKQEKKIVVFQNFVNKNGTFLNDEKGPAPVNMKICGEEVEAYAIADAVAMFLNAPEGEVRLINKDGAEAKTVSAEDFKAAYIGTAEDGTGVIKAGSVEMKNFKYAVASDNEAICFVEKSETLVVADLLKAVGAKSDATKYRFVATDKFYLETDAAAAATSEIRGTLSGAVNAALSIEIASGKINDILYVDIID